MRKIKIAFISKNLFDILSLRPKVMDKFQVRVGRDIFFDISKHLLRILSITFFWRLIITKGFLEMKFRFNFQLLLVQSFLKNVVLLCQNEVWNSTLTIIITFWQWAVKLSSSNYPISFEDLWETINLIIKQPLHLSCSLYINEEIPSYFH